ncbi:TrbC family F-type conjugative pilus assembly protein [Escherichia coli]|uniref:TrbC family F-type conjugative pilus assembly protein n=1 Tax=Escherichia coli TaxID=562 RepID=UPI0033067FE8
MKLSMKSLAALLMMLNGAVMASENVNTPENRQFLKQQENLSRQLREKPDHQLKAWAEKQVLETPLQRSDNHFLDELVRKQQASQDGKPRQGALYFVSFSIPEEGLKRMLGETRHYGIPATLRGMVNNDLKTTAEAVLSLVKDGATDGVLNRPGFPGECFICELRLPDHRFRWKHNKLFLLLPVGYGPAFPAIVDCYTSPPT